MVKIISIQRAAGCGVVQFIQDGRAGALRFDAVRKLVESVSKAAAGKGRKNARSRKG